MRTATIHGRSATIPAPHDKRTVMDWVHLIRAEYTESPGLRLTKPQVRRLWNLDPKMCDAVLEALEADRFLRKTHTGAYVKVDN
jgi:hypothetical protein